MTGRSWRFAGLVAGLSAMLAMGSAGTLPAAAADDRPVAWSVPDVEMAGLVDAYQRAIRNAAIKHPSDARPLLPITGGGASVRVVALKWTGGGDIVDRNGRLNRDVWVSLPAELKPNCRGARDPILALQQVLGQPPQTGDYILWDFSIAKRQLFRPCASGGEIATPSCSVTLPNDPDAEARAKVDAEFAATRAFVFEQMWSSYTRNVHSFGYPFTGMGWSYDWNPKADDTYGISEYIARKGARVQNVRKVSPLKFCR